MPGLLGGALSKGNSSTGNTATGSRRSREDEESRVVADSVSRDGGVGTPDPLEEIKRKTYPVVLILGFVPLVLLTANIGDAGSFARPLFPVLGAVFVWCLWGLLTRRAAVRVVEKTVFFATSSVFLAQLAYVLSVTDSLSTAQSVISENIYTTFTVLYVISYLIFETSRGLKVSLAISVAGLAMVVARMLHEGLANLSAEEISWVLRTHVYMAAVVVLLHTMAHAKAQFERQRTLADEMSNLALTDQLTGISNRRKLYHELQREVAGARRHSRPLSVILFDLDHFKRINDAYGHDRGDDALKSVTTSMLPFLRSHDHFGRWGGEEFMLIAPDTDCESARSLAERLRNALSSTRVVPTGSMTASFGLSCYRPDEKPEALIKRADEALYSAKENGRDRVEVRP